MSQNPGRSCLKNAAGSLESGVSPELGEVLHMHVGKETAFCWEGCNGLAHHLGSLLCVGLQIDLDKGPLPLGCALLLLSSITCTTGHCTLVHKYVRTRAVW